MSIDGKRITRPVLPTPWHNDLNAETMTEADLDSLIADTDAQLDAAQQAVSAGEIIDLSDLLPRIDRICALALAQRRREAAERLAGILPRLDALQTALRERIARLGAEARPDPKRAAETYRAAATPPSDERK
jgi:hypothetical protein